MTPMSNKANKTIAKRLSKAKRTRARRLKQAVNKELPPVEVKK